MSGAWGLSLRLGDVGSGISGLTWTLKNLEIRFVIIFCAFRPALVLLALASEVVRIMRTRRQTVRII